jgi:hypothetical protein
MFRKIFRSSITDPVTAGVECQYVVHIRALGYAGDDKCFWKNRSNRTKVRPGFSIKSREAVPKTEVLEQPRLKLWFAGLLARRLWPENHRAAASNRSLRQPGFESGSIFENLGVFYEITVKAYINHHYAACSGRGGGIFYFAYAGADYADRGGFHEFGGAYRKILHDH